MIIRDVKMSDIAKLFNVSTVTVSKALADKDGVSKELKEKIKNAAKEMGYRYNANAKAMKDGKTYNIGIIISSHFVAESIHSFYWNMYQKLVILLKQYNYYSLLEIVEGAAENEGILPDILNENKIDGLIIIGQMSKEYVNKINVTGLPLVLLDFYIDDFNMDMVLSDNFYGMFTMTNYLIQNGHRKIAFIGSVKATSSIQDRFLGYYKSLLQHNIPLRSDWVIDDRDKNGNFVDIPFPNEMPTAFLCNCDEVAYSFIKKLNEHGYIVPSDISVAGFDNYLFATLSNPPLTTVNVDINKMTKEAVDLLVARLKSQSTTNSRVFVSGELVIRDSVAAIG